VLLALVGVFSLFDVINQMGEVGRADYHVGHALLFVLLLVPAHAYELMPIATLIGTIYALSRLAASSEFTIMRVSGMGTVDLVRAVMRAGLAFAALAFLLGEAVAPPAENLAQRFKTRAQGLGVGAEFRSGTWVRDLARADAGEPERLRFVNVERVEPDGAVLGWRIFEFDPALHLRSLATAASGTYERGQGWLLRDVVETRLPPLESDAQAGDVQVHQDPVRLWRSELTPAIFGVLMVQPERQSVVGLVRYLRHLADNHQRTDRYETALWKKLFYPIICMVMMALALPFAYLHVRAGTVSVKIFAGIMIGVVFYALNRLFSHLGALNTWPPVLVAGLPAVVALVCALGALAWIERR
jgi:lipopolysaccharide export system permease protein